MELLGSHFSPNMSCAYLRHVIELSEPLFLHQQDGYNNTHITELSED